MVVAPLSQNDRLLGSKARCQGKELEVCSPSVEMEVGRVSGKRCGECWCRALASVIAGYSYA